MEEGKQLQTLVRRQFMWSEPKAWWLELSVGPGAEAQRKGPDLLPVKRTWRFPSWVSGKTVSIADEAGGNSTTRSNL